MVKIFKFYYYIRTPPFYNPPPSGLLPLRGHFLMYPLYIILSIVKSFVLNLSHLICTFLYPDQAWRGGGANRSTDPSHVLLYIYFPFLHYYHLSFCLLPNLSVCHLSSVIHSVLFIISISLPTFHWSFCRPLLIILIGLFYFA